MNVTSVLDLVMGPGGTLAFAILSLYVFLSGKYVVPISAHEREKERVDQYDAIVQDALQVSRDSVKHDEAEIVAHQKIIEALNELAAAQTLQIEREGWTRERERKRDEGGGP